jgi:DNA-binding transcriptional ArsR family regulator
MKVPEGLETIHQPARLQIMALLYQRGDIGATAAREATGLTAGNLESHAGKLAEGAYVEARKVLTSHGFEARYRITRAGMEVMKRYLDWLQAFADGLRDPT